jgi:hypothetical protein
MTNPALRLPGDSVLIVGTMNCCICGGEMTQDDITRQEAILSGASSTVFSVVAHVWHFFGKKDGKYSDLLPEYELNVTKFSLAVALENGGLAPEREIALRLKIKNLEQEFEHKQTPLPVMTPAEAAKQLQSAVCYCGAPKRIKNSFCKDCFRSLPYDIRNRLYRSVFNGYTEAYRDACSWFYEKKRRRESGERLKFD